MELIITTKNNNNNNRHHVRQKSRTDRPIWRCQRSRRLTLKFTLTTRGDVSNQGLGPGRAELHYWGHWWFTVNIRSRQMKLSEKRCSPKSSSVAVKQGWQQKRTANLMAASALARNKGYTYMYSKPAGTSNGLGCVFSSKGDSQWFAGIYLSIKPTAMTRKKDREALHQM